MAGFGASVVVGGELDRVGRVGRLMEGRLDYPFMPTKTISYTEGVLLEVLGTVDVYEIVYKPPMDIELTSIAVGASRYHPTDSWSVFIGEDEEMNYVCKNIYTKDVPEGIQLMAVRTVLAGTPITFRYDNKGGQSKYAWVNFAGLRDEPTEEEEGEE